jgi:hypothetical protein
MQDEGSIQHIGLSNVTVEQFDAALTIADIAAVTALFNVGNRSGSGLLAAAERSGAVFSPWHPASLRDGGDNAELVATTLAPIAAAHDATPQQIAIAWLLHRSSAMLPIPGTTSLAHLRENVAAGSIVLSDDEVVAISRLADEASDSASG